MAVEVNTRVLEHGGGSLTREIVHVAGTRPNFVKMGPVIAALAAYRHVRLAAEGIPAARVHFTGNTLIGDDLAEIASVLAGALAPAAAEVYA